MSVIDRIFHSARDLHVYAQQNSVLGTKSSRYHAINYMAINNMSMIYILPALCKDFWDSSC